MKPKHKINPIYEESAQFGKKNYTNLMTICCQNPRKCVDQYIHAISKNACQQKYSNDPNLVWMCKNGVEIQRQEGVKCKKF